MRTKAKDDIYKEGLFASTPHHTLSRENKTHTYKLSPWGFGTARSKNLPCPHTSIVRYGN